jgi:hypothetical protein
MIQPADDIARNMLEAFIANEPYVWMGKDRTGVSTALSEISAD